MKKVSAQRGSLAWNLNVNEGKEGDLALAQGLKEGIYTRVAIAAALQMVLG